MRIATTLHELDAYRWVDRDSSRPARLLGEDWRWAWSCAEEREFGRMSPDWESTCGQPDVVMAKADRLLALRQLVATFVTGDEPTRNAVRVGVLSRPELSRVLLGAARSYVADALEAADPVMLDSAMASLSLVDGRTDIRDVLPALRVVWSAARPLGLVGEELFSRRAGWFAAQPKDMSAIVRRFGSSAYLRQFELGEE